jgi:hypothetical protein
VMPRFFFDVEHGLTLYEDHEGVVCPNLDVARQMAQDLINDLHEDAERIRLWPIREGSPRGGPSAQ